MPRTADHIAGHLNLYSDRYDPYGSRLYLYRPRSFSDFRRKRNSAISENIFLDSTPKSPTILSVISTDDGKHEPVLLTIIENANMDGVRHLQADNPFTKYCWAAIIIIFVLLACFQIFKQINMYMTTPVATNIEAAYPNQIPFPVVAICNNNQFRLTYLTGPAIQNRKPKEHRSGTYSSKGANATIFDKVLENAWDMDAVKFLRNAAHWKSRMILSCTWPNGTSCRLSNFKAVWTLTGLCWAINTDPYNPHYISSSGSGSGLKLLLNIESYERVESCTPYFRTMSLPGLKILIYNQTDIPESSLDGVNVPPGYTMEIPYRMQKRHKYSGGGCLEESDENRARTLSFFDPDNIHTCSIRSYLHEVEQRCRCSMSRAYNPNPVGRGHTFCNVEQYLTCVLPLQTGKKQSFDRFRCTPPCDQIDYTAWQDMTLLPNNIFPSLIETAEEEDVEDVIDDYDVENDSSVMEIQRDEHFQCEENQLLSTHQIHAIKRAAQRAYEKQSRYQDDIQLRTKRLILKLRNATQKLIENGWGWTDETYHGVFSRLNTSISCFNVIPIIHAEIFTAIESPPTPNEETRIANLYRLVAPEEDPNGAKRFRTVAQLREAIGERFDEIVKEMQRLSNTVMKLSKIYEPSSYKSTLGVKLERMDVVLGLVKQYEAGRLQRRAWAEKMQSRNMRHFFDQDFFEGWYNPILRDLDENLMRNIVDMEDDDLPMMLDAVDDGRGLQLGSILYFGDMTQQHMEQFGAFVQDIIECTFTEVKNESAALLNSFKKVMHEFQSAYTNLFKKELPNYLANFDFGSAFVEQNFAMVNVFLHRMNVETWRQESTYSIWSLACDVGGALGLFLGASLLTVIELIYLCFQYGLCTAQYDLLMKLWNTKTHPTDDKPIKKKGNTQKPEIKLDGITIRSTTSSTRAVSANGNAPYPTSQKSPSPIMEVDEIDETLIEQNQLTTGSSGTNEEKCETVENGAQNGDTTDFADKADDSLESDRLLGADSSENLPTSRSSSRKLRTKYTSSFEDSNSSDSVDRVTTLFRPKQDRQTFV